MERESQQDNNQAYTFEVLKLLIDELKENRDPERRENEGTSSSITKVLGDYRESNPLAFKGSHDLNVALEWMNQMKKIFGLMDCKP